MQTARITRITRLTEFGLFGSRQINGPGTLSTAGTTTIEETLPLGGVTVNDIILTVPHVAAPVDLGKCADLLVCPDRLVQAEAVAAIK